MAINEDYVREVAREQMLPNARFRNEFIRLAEQDPGAFYSRYGIPRPVAPPGLQPSWINPAMLQFAQQYGGQYQPSQTIEDIFRQGGSWDGEGTGVSDSSGTTGFGGGMLGNDPNLGAVLGALGSLGGIQGANIAGQAISGTPSSLGHAVTGAIAGQFGPLGVLGHQAVTGTLSPTNATMAAIAAVNPSLAATIALGRGLYGIFNPTPTMSQTDTATSNTDGAMSGPGGYGFGVMGSGFGPDQQEADNPGSGGYGIGLGGAIGDVGAVGEGANGPASSGEGEASDGMGW